MSRTAVILVNYNGARDTAECLRSLYASLVIPHVVIVDNTPRDPALVEVIAEYSSVHLIDAPENKGFGHGNNLGIEWVMSNTDCEYVFILNNDATVEPDTIKKLEKVLNDHPDVGISTPRIVFMNDSSMLWYGGGEVSWLRGSAVTPGFMGSSEAPLAMKSRHVSFASGCALLVRRQLLQKIGGFDDRFFMYEEDLEFCLRTRENGFKIWYEAAALVHHVSHGAIADNTHEQHSGYISMLNPLNPNLSFYVFQQVRNRLLNMRMHAYGYNRVLFVCGFTLFLLKKIIQFSFAKRWDGVIAAFRGWRSYVAVYKT